MPKKKCHDVDGAYFGCSFANILLVVTSRLIEGIPRFGSSTLIDRFCAKNIWVQDLWEERLEIPIKEIKERANILHTRIVKEIKDEEWV